MALIRRNGGSKLNGIFNHLLRKIDQLFDFNFIYEEVEELYSPIGKESIDPVVLFKICFIQYLFGIRSMRRTIEEINCNVAYRWFLGYNLDETISLHLERIMLEDLLVLIFSKKYLT